MTQFDFEPVPDDYVMPFAVMEEIQNVLIQLVNKYESESFFTILTASDEFTDNSYIIIFTSPDDFKDIISVAFRGKTENLETSKDHMEVSLKEIVGSEMSIERISDLIKFLGAEIPTRKYNANGL